MHQNFATTRILLSAGRVLSTWYIFSVLLLDTSYLILFLMSNAERRLKNIEGRYNVPGTKYQVEIRIGIEVLVFKDLGTLYLVLRTTFSFLLLDT